ncbi:hypothetical protein J2W30_003655 [Variovorax boronicumulans]|uniref:hypothetical protein n=1 Tax=Variovorax boronicumulans TaxID=436515 RepID=UPI00277E9B8D|nr:hypothetical protein [Variovorax boronicumulans]MDQ0035882.1 hypothetical protein [Variovorax boronicumulans]
MTHPPIKAPFELPQTEAAAMRDLHNAIMNIPAVPPEDANVNQIMPYKVGHRDARHAAAELALSHPAAQAGAVQAVTDEQIDAVIRIVQYVFGGQVGSSDAARWAEMSNRARKMIRESLAATQPSAAPAESLALEQEPIDMVLHCPKCNLQHVDASDATECAWPQCSCADQVDRGCIAQDVSWTNPPHRSHLCHGCGHIWRPADVPTNGVQAVKTTGKADSAIAATQNSAQRTQSINDYADGLEGLTDEARRLNGLMLAVWACAKPQPDVPAEKLRDLLGQCLPHIRKAALDRSSAERAPSAAPGDGQGEVSDEIALVKSVLRGYPQSFARGDALRAVEKIEKALAAPGAAIAAREQEMPYIVHPDDPALKELPDGAHVVLQRKIPPATETLSCNKCGYVGPDMFHAGCNYVARSETSLDVDKPEDQKRLAEALAAVRKQQRNTDLWQCLGASPAAAPTSQPNAAAQEQQAGWMPIESAPKSRDCGDGRIEGVYLLGFCPEPDVCNLESAVCVVWWEPLMNKGKGMWYGEGGFETRPTLWQPLPPAPAPTGMGSVGLPSGRGEEA